MCRDHRVHVEGGAARRSLAVEILTVVRRQPFSDSETASDEGACPGCRCVGSSAAGEGAGHQTDHNQSDAFGSHCLAPGVPQGSCLSRMSPCMPERRPHRHSELPVRQTRFTFGTPTVRLKADTTYSSTY